MENNSAQAGWTEVKEISRSGRSIKFTAFLVKILPHRLLIALTKFISIFYFLGTKWARKCSKEYQQTLIDFSKNLPDYLKGTDISKVPSRPNSYHHISSFATCLVEKIEGWSGKSGMKNIEFADSNIKEEIRNLLKSGSGCMLICSHLGNIELFRSIFSNGSEDFDRIIPVTIIMDRKVTANFNTMIENLNSNAKLNVICSDDISMGTMNQLQDTIENGGLVVISADRIPAHNTQRSIDVSFLGKNAKLPCGPFLIAALLKCPVYFIFSMRKYQSGFNPTYIINLIKSDVSFEEGRKERDQKILKLAGKYIKLMEKFVILYPYQWYNFFSYWSL
jgi:predicted LPLAT superfamily acyltransferase